MSSLFNKYAGKAQQALNQTPLGQYIPPQYQVADNTTGGTPSGAPQATTGTGTAPPPANYNNSEQPHPIQYSATTASQSTQLTGQRASAGNKVADTLRQHGFSSLQNHLRSMQVQHSKGPDRQIQLAITAQKSVAIQFEGAGRDAQVYSKELYLWGQDQTEDIKDVTDRLAYLNFVHGQISTDLSKELETARGPWKTARATESTSGTLKASGRDTTEVSNEAAVSQREALKDGEAARWKALREYAEKLILLTQAAEVIVEECLPPPATTIAYSPQAKQRTADVRSTLQRTLDSWQLSPAIAATSPFIPPSQGGLAADGRSFGETHRQELDRTPSVVDRQNADRQALEAHTGIGSAHRPAGPAPVSGSGGNSTGVNPAQLNNAPAPVPSTYSGGLVTSPSSTLGPTTAGSPTIPPTAPLNLAGKKTGGSNSGTALAAGGAGLAAAGLAAISSSSSHPPSASTNTNIAGSPSASTVASHPTVAETGVPISSSGPGPASGSLLASGPGSPPPASTNTGATWTGPVQGGGPGGFRDPRDVGPQGTSQAVKYETAEEEKKRLEREDRERLLRFGTGANANAPSASASAYTAAPAPGPGPSTATAGLGSAPPRNETAEEEKKRLEREERERLLRGQDSNQSGQGQGGPPGQDDGNDLPAYKPY